MTPNPWHVRLVEVEAFFSTELPAGTFAFGASRIDGLTLAHVRTRVERRDGKVADGWGAIFLSHPWAFPGSVPDPAVKDAAMRRIVETTGAWLAANGDWGHPIDHFLAIEPELGRISREIASAQGIDVEVPALASLVSLSPVDAAIHDAFGKAFGTSSYDLLTHEQIGWDLGRLLGPTFSGKAPADFLRRGPIDRLTISHTVGATDPLTIADATGDAIQPLERWIAQDGVRSFKVKLKGRDLDWDVQRVVDIVRVARTVLGDGGVRVFADLNEQAPSVEYVHSWLDGVEAADPVAYEALDAVEQPMSRHLGPDAPSLVSVSERIPVVLDEGLTSLATIDAALDRGWSGIALKTCKTQSLMLLALAKAAPTGLHVSVQDLTNPGIALLQSAGLAARLPVTRSMETNARQYYPHVSGPEADAWPGVFGVADGSIATGDLAGPGLGYAIESIRRPIFETADRH